MWRRRIVLGFRDCALVVAVPLSVEGCVLCDGGGPLKVQRNYMTFFHTLRVMFPVCSERLAKTPC
jgi:hypothetical protein